MKKYIFILFLTVLACVSFGMMLKFYLSLEHLSDINERKIICFLIMHAYFVIMVWCLLTYDSLAGYVSWLTWVTGVIFLLMLLTETL